MTDLALQNAALAAGMIDLDCLQLLPDSDAAPAERIAAMRANKPHLFTVNARTMTTAEYKAALDKMLSERRRDALKSQDERATARVMSDMDARAARHGGR